MAKLLRLLRKIEYDKEKEEAAASDGQSGFFAFSETKQQIDDKADKGNGCDHPPQGFFSHGAEIFLSHVHNGPDGAHEKRHT
jgi:hypothetical protein